MTPEQIERLLKLIALGTSAFMEAQIIINNHKMQAGKTEEQVLDEAQKKTEEALEIINNL